MTDDERRALRHKDFWTALVLLALSALFLWKTAQLPFFKASAAGVEAEWYNSAALVPYGIFAAIALCALNLLRTSIRHAGLPGLPSLALSSEIRAAAPVVLSICAILALYIFALVPRVDFVICSALVITALVTGFHSGRAAPRWAALAAVGVAGAYALILHFPQSEWSAPHDDDLVALAAFAGLAVVNIIEASRAGSGQRIARAAPIVGILMPLMLICVMAFGFRQNVPNRGGLVFGTIEYHYYVTVRPWLSGD